MEGRRRCRGCSRCSARTKNILLDAREQSMNSFVRSKTEVFEKIEESLRPLCIISNELNACETTAILNPSKFASCVKGLQWI